MLVGEPIYLDDLVKENKDQQGLYDVIAMRVSERLQELKSELDQLVLDGKQSVTAQVFERRGGSWERVDWDNNGALKDFAGLSRTNAESEDRGHTQIQGMAEPPRMGNLEHDSRIGGLYPAFDNTSISVEAREALDIIAQQGGMMGRLQAFMNPAMSVGFAARGLFQTGHARQRLQSFGSSHAVTGFEQF